MIVATKTKPPSSAETPSPETFRRNLRARMDDLGMDVDDLAERMGVHASYVYAYLGGQREPGLKVIDKFASAVECKSCDLIDPDFSKIPK